MGYRCPVCETPQVDAGHLANHLAFTAMLHDDEHASWLDEHVPRWGEMGEHDLAAALADHCEEVDLSDVFDDTAIEDPTDPVEERSGMLFDDDDSHGHGNGEAHRHEAPGHRPDRAVPLDPEAQAILDEARAMTREMLSDDEGDVESDENA